MNEVVSREKHTPYSAPLSIQKDYQFVMSGESTHDIRFLPSSTIHLKKAINLVLDSIIAIIASVLETNYCL